jgi:FlaA1/EpsC-like NDP-sugar epimerase
MWRRRVDGTVRSRWTAHLARRVSRLDLRQRVGLQIALDSLAMVIGLTSTQIARFDYTLHALSGFGFWVICALAVCLLHFLGTALHLYLGRYRFGGFEEVLGLLVAVLLTIIGLVIVIAAFGTPRPMPLSVPPLGGTVTLVVMFGVRYLWRLLEERLRRPDRDRAEPILVFGAGQGGESLITALLRSQDSPYYPVALLDDDPKLYNLQLLGVRVRGGRDAIGPVAAATGARTLLVAIPSADADLLREISGIAENAGLAVKVVPRVADLIDGRVGVADIRDLDLADLLGRRQISTDMSGAANYLTGRRVLVTGAGGSIGSELCRQIARFTPAKLIMLDRDESALRAVQLSISGRAMLDDDAIVLADIRDGELITRLFTERRPQVVFHAAALKHLPLLERFPGESVKTNVWGTLTILRTALACGVERLVNISTDKAANPASALGYSKRITERLTAHLAKRADGTFVSVRFGNVLGSNGSVLTVFAGQLAAGGPITVTHPEVSRYFMTIPEAVELVLQAGAIGAPGEALVLDMGEPVRIDDVARRLAAREPRPIDIVYTGLGTGEKLHEELFGDGEADQRPHHPLISHVDVPALDPALALALDPSAPPAQVLRQLAALARTSAPAPAPATTPVPAEARNSLVSGLIPRQPTDGPAPAADPASTADPARPVTS